MSAWRGDNIEEIITGLWLGGIDDIKNGIPEEIDVVYDIRRWIPFPEFGPIDISGELLDSICCLIHEERKQLKQILVHCTGGIERSPLVVAWYLCKYDVHDAIDTLDDAYEYIQCKRRVFDRSSWVPWDDRLERGFV